MFFFSGSFVPGVSMTSITRKLCCTCFLSACGADDARHLFLAKGPGNAVASDWLRPGCGRSQRSDAGSRDLLISDRIALQSTTSCPPGKRSTSGRHFPAKFCLSQWLVHFLLISSEFSATICISQCQQWPTTDLLTDWAENAKWRYTHTQFVTFFVL